MVRPTCLLLFLLLLSAPACAPPAREAGRESTPPPAQVPPPPAPPAQTSPPAPAQPAAPQPPASEATSLTVVVDLGDGSGARTSTLTCGSPPVATGSVTDPAAACQAVTSQRDLLVQGPPEGRACTMIYGGPQRATIVGTLAGEKVESTITRSNGCGIADWSALEALLGPPS